MTTTALQLKRANRKIQEQQEQLQRALARKVELAVNTAMQKISTTDPEVLSAQHQLKLARKLQHTNNIGIAKKNVRIDALEEHLRETREDLEKQMAKKKPLAADVLAAERKLQAVLERKRKQVSAETVDLHDERARRASA